MPFSAVLDACVLYPAGLRDTLLRIADTGLYRPLWTERILDEVSGAMRRNDRTAAQVRHLREALTGAFEDAVVTGWEPLEPVVGNDPKDRHVLAAAVKAHADVIVTRNLKDFPASAVAPFDIDVQSPDAFLCFELELDPPSIVHVLHSQAADTGTAGRLRLSVQDVLTKLEHDVGACAFAESARAWIEILSDSPGRPWLG